jgi:RES domain-containing protein
LVELLVHIEIDSDDLSDTVRYLEIDAPDDISAETVSLAALERNWQRNQTATRTIGDEWLRSHRTALFRVPSVIVPATWNILINPQHPESDHIEVLRIHRHRVDPRLVR